MLAFYTSIKNKLTSFFGSKYGCLYFVGLIVFAQALRRSHGSLKSNHLILLSLITFFALVDQFKNGGLTKKAKVLCFFIFAVMSITKFEIIYSASESWRYLYAGGFALVLALAFVPNLLKWPASYYQRCALGLMVLLLCLVPFASTNPAVDVWVYFERASAELLNFSNPYLVKYPDIYHGAHHYNPLFIYWPLNLYLMAPIALIADIRFSLIIAFALTAMILGKKYKLGFWEIGIFLLFPINIFVIEQSWIEPLMLPFMALHFYSIKKEKYIQAGIWLGLLCALKQFMLFPFLLSSFYLYRKSSFKKTLIAPAIIVATFTPFLISAPEVFLKNTFLAFLNFPERIDSLSWVAFSLYHFEASIPSVVIVLLYLGIFLYCLWVLARNLNPASLKWGHFLTLAIVFLFGKQSFANYYFVLFFIYYLAIIERTDKVPTS